MMVLRLKNKGQMPYKLMQLGDCTAIFIGEDSKE
jgi:hypothetical protein